MMSLGTREVRQLTSEGKWIGDLDWSEDGRELVFSSDRQGIPRLWRMNVSNGKVEPALTGENSWYVSVARSGHRLIYSETASNFNIERFTLPTAQDPKGAWGTLFASTRNEYGAQYSRDGRRIAFISDRTGARQIWLGDSDGQNAHPLKIAPAGVISFDWSPDGKQFVFYTRAGPDLDIYVVSVDGGVARRLTGEGADDLRPRWSPDGQFVYYESNRSGDWQIWRVRPDGSQPERVTRNGGLAARLSADGRYVYYAKGLTIPGIWRSPTDGGEEVRVTDFPKEEFSGTWDLAQNGVYWLDGRAPGMPPPPTLFFYDFATRQNTTVTTLEQNNVFYNDYALRLSPDARNLLLAYSERSTSDLVLVQGYR